MQFIVRQCHGITFTVVQIFVINSCSSCVVCGKLQKYCIYIFKILNLMVLIVKVNKGVHGIKYYKFIWCIYIYEGRSEINASYLFPWKLH